MNKAYTIEYFAWKGIRDEMIALKKAYGKDGVPKATWDQLEDMCKQAATNMIKAA